MVCGGLRINKHGPVEEIFPDGFVFWKGERILMDSGFKIYLKQWLSVKSHKMWQLLLLKVTKDHIPVWTSRSQQPMSWPTQESQPKMTHLWPFPKMSRRARQKKRRISNMLFSAHLHTKCVAKVMFLLLSNCFDISDNYPKGEVCVDKCCRGSKVLQTSPNEKLECVASNGSEWNSENLKLQLGVESLNIRSWLFYLKRNLKVPIISRFNSILIICIA